MQDRGHDLRGAAGARHSGDREDLQHRRDRRRRHRGRDHRRDPRHGGSSRGQGLRHDRHGRPRPEGRRGLQPCPPRQRRRTTSTPSASRPARPTSCSAATSSSPARRRCWPRSAPGRTGLVVNTAEIMPGDFTRNADFSLPAERIKRAITRGRGRRARRISSTRRAIATGAPRQCHRGEHVHARLRLPARPGAALGRRHPARDRAQRRSGEDEPRRLRLGPPRRGRAGASSAASWASSTEPTESRHLSQTPRRDHRPPGRVPDRLPERRLCRALPR